MTGIGVGALVKVNGITAQNFKGCWSHLFNHFKGYGITIDKQTCDITRQNVISFDPNIYINENAASLYADQITTQTYTCIQPFQDSKDSTWSSLFSGFEETVITDSLRIKHRTTLDDYPGKNYVVIETGKEFRSCFLPKEIRDGERDKWMVGHTVSLLFNNPTVTMEKLYNSVFHSNLTHCHPPMMNSEIMSIVKWYWAKHSRGMLDYHPKLKKIWFDPSVNIHRNEKRKIVGVETGRLRRGKTLKTLKLIYLELVGHLAMVFVLVIIIKMANIDNGLGGLLVGLLGWIGFVVPLEIGELIWEKIPFRLFMIRIGNQFIGMGISGFILGAWQ